MRINLFKYWPWLFAFLLIPYAYYVWINTPSRGYDKPDCADYASDLSRNDIIISATGDASQQNQTKTDEKIKLKASVECSDLHAQWSMADVTFWAFSAGIPAIILVFWTLIATRKGINVTKESSVHQLRAYLDVSIDNKFDLIGGEKASVFIDVKNVGQTPAIDCVFETAVGIDLCVEPQPSSTRHGIVINPQSFKSGLAKSDSAIEREIITGIYKNEYKLLIRLKAFYSDVFGKHWVVTVKAHFNAFEGTWGFPEMKVTERKDAKDDGDWTYSPAE